MPIPYLCGFMHERILILDFGSQYTQLIARRVRELNVFCEILPFHSKVEMDESVKGIILSGSPFSVADPTAPHIDLDTITGQVPILGICYGAQYVASRSGGKVTPTSKREYGRARLSHINASNPLFAGMSPDCQVWMSHSDTILEVPDNFEVIGSTSDVRVAAYEVNSNGHAPLFGIQFHPEVTHSTEGKQLLKNFVWNICSCRGDWTPENFAEETVERMREQLGDDNVVLGLSGGVDSSVSAELLHRAIGKRLHCIFVDNGLLRKNEFEEVLHSFKDQGYNITGVDAKEQFYAALKGIRDPELKRKAIGKTFIDVFVNEATRITNVKWLGQGTIYPDVIESVSVHGPSATIKSHHNVGGLPEKMHLKVVEPLRALFKDEVREVGKALGLPDHLIGRHPFPGPGLGIRILSDINAEKVRILQEADALFINGLREHDLYDKVWQAGAMLLPVQSVGVMGDERTYENVLALRAVTSMDGMTADWCHLPYNFLAEISTKIINQVKGINRVVYDISSKPPATIEWE